MKSIYGESGIQPYGTGPREEHGTAFRIKGIPATFSVLTLDGTLRASRGRIFNLDNSRQYLNFIDKKVK